MRVLDIYENSAYDPAEDRLNKRSDDTRKPKLTLKHLNKLRKMREFKKLDMKEREDFWQVIYGVPEIPMEPQF